MKIKTTVLRCVIIRFHSACCCDCCWSTAVTCQCSVSFAVFS